MPQQGYGEQQQQQQGYGEYEQGYGAQQQQQGYDRAAAWSLTESCGVRGFSLFTPDPYAAAALTLTLSRPVRHSGLEPQTSHSGLEP